MRKTIFGVANSLDNFIAREDDGIDWLLWSDDVTQIMEEFWKNMDTVLMGRKAYEATAAMAEPAPYAAKTYVFSRTIKDSPDPKITFVSEDAIDFVRNLKARDGKDICVMGGGEFARSLFEGGLIDEVHLNIHPVILGSGIPLFLPMERQIDLELIESKTLSLGCVSASYRVKK